MAKYLLKVDIRIVSRLEAAITRHLLIGEYDGRCGIQQCAAATVSSSLNWIEYRVRSYTCEAANIINNSQKVNWNNFYKLYIA